MKRYVSLMLVLFSFMCISAQGYEPTTKWPYLYNDFTTGTVLFKDKTKSTALFNIHLLGGLLHSEKNGQIYHIDIANIAGVEISGDNFIPLEGKLVKVVASSNGNNDHLVLLTEGDFEALFSSTGAYGMDANVSAVNKLSSLEIGGVNNLNYSQLLQEKQEGRSLPLKSKYIYLINDKIVNATKKDIEKSLDKEGSAKFQAFLKANKINWKSEEGLIKLLSFFSLI